MTRLERLMKSYK